MSDTGDEWQVARRRKGGARKCKYNVFSYAAGLHEELDVEKLVKRIRETVSELRSEDFWHKWKEQLLVSTSTSQLRPPEMRDTGGQLEEDRDGEPSQHLKCVCYGLGSFSSCASARYQLAMLLLLLDAGQIRLQDCSVYDPMFSSGEKDVLRELGLIVLTENEEGKHLVTKLTLFYMIHCGKALYNNLLWKNWSAQHLSRVMIVGNSFSGMRERTIEREFKKDYRYLSEAGDLCEERQLPCPSRLIDVFSDTAIITFPSDSINGLPQSSWLDSPEPQYQHCSNLEIILKETQK